MTAPAQFDTFRIDREFAVPLSRLYAAFADPERKRRWFAEGQSHDVEQFSMQFEVGGRELARYRFREGTPFPGSSIESDGVVLDVVPEQRIVIANTMAMNGRRFSASVHTFEFSETPAGGAHLAFTHQAAFFEGADGPAMRRMGWEQLLEQLQQSLDARA